jgi:hypothetical protein
VLVHDQQVGLVAQVVDLGPEHRHAAARLEICAAVLLAALARDDKLLALVEVAHLAVLVDAARKVARAGTVPRAARNEAKREARAVDAALLQLEEAKDDRLDEAREVGAGLCLLDEALRQVAVPEEALVGLAGDSASVLQRSTTEQHHSRAPTAAPPSSGPAAAACCSSGPSRS